MLRRLAAAAASIFVCAAPGVAGAQTPDLAALLAEAEAHGLARPGDGELAARLRHSDPQVRQAAAAGLEPRLIAYASDQHAGRAAPSQVDRRWAYRPEPYDAAAAFAAARDAGTLGTWAAGLAPRHGGYRALVAARPRYAAAAAAGDWAPLALTSPLSAGAKGADVVKLRQRLALEGFDSADETPELFGPSLDSVVRSYQAARGLAVDGVVGPATTAALNTPASERLAQIDLALERWRWLPRALPPRRIEVNVAAAEAVLIDEGEAVLRTRLVVGDPRHETPLFSSTVHSVVFNPPWNVPASIARNEILPKAARDRGYLARNHYRYVDGQLQQAPGPWNALGRLKLDFENPFGVYLHDTPSRAAFARPRRTLSHGCMRLEKPRELAALLLAPQGWSAKDIDAAIAAGVTRRVALSVKTPIFVTYQTAWAQPDGTVAFAPDVYGWDARLSAALAQRQRVASAGPALESECALAQVVG